MEMEQWVSPAGQGSHVIHLQIGVDPVYVGRETQFILIFLRLFHLLMNLSWGQIEMLR